MKQFRYSVAIRTLGLAGDIYQRELDSLAAQTIRPERIIVYLAEGYERPKQTIGWEQVVTVRKGMVSQRALPYDEIESPHILMLDDDVYLPPDAVERMAEAMLREQADCVAADTFANHEMSLVWKLHSAVTNWAFPIWSSRWAITIQRNGAFCYNARPVRPYYLTQCAAGPCSLWRKSAFLGIRFTDELWLDRLGFAYGDDVLFFYKLYVNGGKLLMHYATGIRHMDGQTSRRGYNADPQKLRKRARAQFLLWWRIDFNLAGKLLGARMLSLAEFALRMVWGVLLHMAYGVLTLSCKPLWNFLRGNVDAYRYVHSDTYRRVPNFKLQSE